MNILFYNLETSKPIILQGDGYDDLEIVHVEDIFRDKDAQKLPELRGIIVNATNIDRTYTPHVLKIIRNQQIYFVVYTKDSEFYVTGGFPTLNFPMRFISSDNKLNYLNFEEFYVELAKKLKSEQIIKTLQIIEPRLIRLELLGTEFYTHIGLREMIPISAMGGGFNRIAQIIIAIASSEGGVVLIDEIENGLHHSTHKNLWKAIGLAAREFQVQIFATTHSLEYLNAAYEAFAEEDMTSDFRYYRLDRRKSGDIEVVNYVTRELEIAREADFEVR